MTTVPAADAAETAARTALAAHDSTKTLADAELRPVRGGLSNHVWRADKDGRRWFVRLGGPDAAALGVDRHSERALLAVVDAAGLAPPLVACDPSNGFLVTHFVAGGPWRREDAHQAWNVQRLADRLRVLHGLEPPSTVRGIDFAAQARRLEAQLRELDLAGRRFSATGPGAEEAVHSAWESGPAIRLIAGSAFRRLASRRPRLVPCHNDLHHLNLLDDGSRLWIVDWEYGGAGDPLFDLASLACQHEYTAAERAALLDTYGAGGAIPASALDAACSVFDYVQWLWYLLWAARNPDASPEYASRARALARRLTASGP